MNQTELKLEQQRDAWQKKAEQWCKTAATLIRYKSYLKLKQNKCDELTRLLEKTAPHICSYLCPCVKKENEPWKHEPLCEAIHKAIGKEVV